MCNINLEVNVQTFFICYFLIVNDIVCLFLTHMEYLEKRGELSNAGYDELSLVRDYEDFQKKKKGKQVTT